jgi:uncharacterized protein YjbI with pentapeptide repeats
VDATTGPSIDDEVATTRHEPRELRAGGTYRHAQLAGADLSGRDLSGCDLTGADLSGARCTGTDFGGAQLNGANLSGANLHQAVFDGAQLLDSSLVRADLTSASMRGVVLGRARLDGAECFGADLTEASLSGASVVNGDFRTATLVGARLRETDLTGAAFSRADLTGVDFFGASVDGADFSDADLRGAHVRALRGFRCATWVGVDIRDVDFTGAYMARRAIMDENYLHEFRTMSRRNEVIYRIWSLTSDCGRSLGRWGLLIAAQIVLFAVAFSMVDLNYGDHASSIAPLYFSVVTMTTLGFGDVLPGSTTATVLVMIEVLTGYVMLGGLLSIFATRMGRRAE